MGLKRIEGFVGIRLIRILMRHWVFLIRKIFFAPIHIVSKEVYIKYKNLAFRMPGFLTFSWLWSKRRWEQDKHSLVTHAFYLPFEEIVRHMHHSSYVRNLLNLSSRPKKLQLLYSTFGWVTMFNFKLDNGMAIAYANWSFRLLSEINIVNGSFDKWRTYRCPSFGFGSRF